MKPWTVTGFKLNNVFGENLENPTHTSIEEDEVLNEGPEFLSGTFEIYDEPKDTFLNTHGWGKGVAYVNGFNLGRYWPSMGPQITLYVPSVYLKSGRNSLVLLELEFVPNNKTMNFQSTPILDCIV